MPRVYHFEIHADDPKRAGAFYSKVFGWRVFKKEGDDYWLFYTGSNDTAGINGGMKKRAFPDASTVTAVEVPSLDECLELIVESGGKILLPRTPVTRTGYIAYCRDTEGNIFSIMEKDISVE